jgi:hypothetical protein
VGGRAAAFPQLRLHSPLGRFLAQLQAHLPLKPVNPLAVDRPAFASKQDMDTAIAIASPCLRDLLDPSLEVGLIGTLATIVVLDRSARSTLQALRMLTCHVLRAASNLDRVVPCRRFKDVHGVPQATPVDAHSACGELRHRGARTKVPAWLALGRKELHLFATRMEHQGGERVVTAATRGFDEPLLAP